MGEIESNAGGSRVDRPALGGVDRPPAVDRITQEVEHPAERLHADRHAHRPSGVVDVHAADQSVGRPQRDATDPIAAEVLLDLARQVNLDALLLGVDREGVENLGQMPFFEFDVERRTDHLGNLSGRGRGGHEGSSFGQDADRLF